MPRLRIRSQQALALALGVLGVAGLSVASASEFPSDAARRSMPLELGSLSASCDAAVDASATYDVAAGTYVALVIANVDPSCQGKTLNYTVRSVTNPGVPAAQGTVTIGTSLNASVSIDSVRLSEELGAVDVSIS